MPQGGASARAARRHAASWWEELDGEAFRFPSAREVRQVPPTRRPSPPPVVPRPAPVAPRRVAVAPPPAPAAVSTTTAGGRRTVIIRGQGAERNLPVARPTLRRHERPGFRPDRMALWAVLLGLCLILVAAASAHGAVLH
jgi:hypothetical protein